MVNPNSQDKICNSKEAGASHFTNGQSVQKNTINYIKKQQFLYLQKVSSQLQGLKLLKKIKNESF